MSHSVTVCVTAPRALASVHGRNGHGEGKCGRGSPPAVGSDLGESPLEKLSTFRCKFLLSGTPSFRKLTHCESAKYYTFAYHICIFAFAYQHEVTLTNGTTGVPARIMTGHGTQARKRDILAKKTGWVAAVCHT